MSPMVHVTLQLRDPGEAPLADLPFGLRIRARAWQRDGERADGKLLTATVHVVRGNERNVVLLAHEAAHALRDADNATMHHPAWHCCGLVGHAVRLFPRGLVCQALTDRELEAGRQLARDGWTHG